MKFRRSGHGPGAPLLFALWGLGLILFNFPMLIVFDRDATVLGLPLLPVALFAIWAMLIGVLAWKMEMGHDKPDQTEAPETPTPPPPPAKP